MKIRLSSVLKISGLFCFLILSSCTSITVQIPIARVYSPEIAKKESLLVEVAAPASQTYTLAEGANQRPPKFTRSSSASTVLTGGLEYGIRDWLSMSLGITHAFGVVGKLQAQLLGPNRFTEGTGTSLSVFSDFAYDSDSANGDQAVIFGPGGFPWKAHGSIMATGAGSSLGYRFDNTFMMYIGYAYQNIKTKVEVNQDPANNNSDQGGIFQDSSDGRTSNATIGFDISSSYASLTPTFQYTEVHWDGKSTYENRVAASLVIFMK